MTLLGKSQVTSCGMKLLGAKGASPLDKVQTGLLNALDCEGPFVLDVLGSDQADDCVFYDVMAPSAA